MESNLCPLSSLYLAKEFNQGQKKIHSVELLNNFLKKQLLCKISFSVLNSSWLYSWLVRVFFKKKVKAMLHMIIYFFHSLIKKVISILVFPCPECHLMSWRKLTRVLWLQCKMTQAITNISHEVTLTPFVPPSPALFWLLHVLWSNRSSLLTTSLFYSERQMILFSCS